MKSRPKKDKVFMNKDNEWFRFLASNEPSKLVKNKYRRLKNQMVSAGQRRVLRNGKQGIRSNSTNRRRNGRTR